MKPKEIISSFADLSTPLLADACVRLDVPIRLAPSGIAGQIPDVKLAGRALPVRHYGSVDIFLEALGSALPGDVLVIDNRGRADEGCIGDLTVLETQASSLSGIVLWGYHRDTAELLKIKFPVFSCGSCPAGPVSLRMRDADALMSARFGELIITRDDFVFADADGVLFVTSEIVTQVLSAAHQIWQTERRQAEAIRDGRTLRGQLKFADYLKRRAGEPGYTFRQYLRDYGGAIEE